MANIVQIDKLYDRYHEMTFGYVGVNLETSEIKYYSFYNHRDHYNPGMLYEFDINNFNSQQLVRHMRYCSYDRPSFSSALPQELKSVVYKVMDIHKNFNIKNGYPTTDLDFNMNNLSIKCINIFNLFGGNNSFSGRYSPVANVIELINNNHDYECMTAEERLKQNNVLAHEIGHMKVTRCKLDEKNKKLLVRIGFYNAEIKLQPLMLENGDIFYKTDNISEKNVNQEGRTLEELINDVDCSNAFSAYIGNYPKLGKPLNDLCNGRLLMARYTNGIDKYYSSLKNIINSDDLATELLENLSESIYGSEPERAEEKAIQLIKIYQNKKVK